MTQATPPLSDPGYPGLGFPPGSNSSKVEADRNGDVFNKRTVHTHRHRQPRPESKHGFHQRLHHPLTTRTSCRPPPAEEEATTEPLTCRRSRRRLQGWQGPPAATTLSHAAIGARSTAIGVTPAASCFTGRRPTATILRRGGRATGRDAPQTACPEPPPRPPAKISTGRSRTSPATGQGRRRRRSRGSPCARRRMGGPPPPTAPGFAQARAPAAAGRSTGRREG